MRLSDLGTIITGKTPTTKKEEYWNGNVPFVTPGDIQGIKHIFKTARNVTEEGMQAVKGAILPPNAVCVSCIGNIGYVGITTKKCVSNQQINSIIVSEDHNHDYVFYLIKSLWPFFKHYEGQSTTLSIMNKTQFSQIEVPDFTRLQEDRIAETLCALDDKIEHNNAINENLLLQVETLFKERFLTCDEMPVGWKRMIIGDVSDMSAGGDKPKNISKQKTEEHLYPIYSNGISEEGLYGFTSDYKISEESVTVSARGTIGFVCLRHIPFTPIVRLVTLVPHTSIVSAKYLYLWLKSIQIHGTGTTQQQLTVPDFRKTEIIIPPEAEMKEFTETVNPLFWQVWSNQAENEKLADIRDALLPKLMSGELDISKLDI